MGALAASRRTALEISAGPRMAGLGVATEEVRSHRSGVRIAAAILTSVFCLQPPRYRDSTNLRISARPIGEPRPVTKSYPGPAWHCDPQAPLLPEVMRSEERRVGKECRSRW